MSQKDYYEVLGVDKGAETKQIKKAYKRLAMKHHPDRNADNKKAAETKFKEIQKAYAILSDDQKRQAYDNLVMQVLMAVLVLADLAVAALLVAVDLAIYLVISLVAVDSNKLITVDRTYAMI